MTGFKLLVGLSAVYGSLLSDLSVQGLPETGFLSLPSELLGLIGGLAGDKASYLTVIQRPMFIIFITKLSVLGGFPSNDDAIEDFWSFNRAEIEMTKGSIRLLKVVALEYLGGYLFPGWKYLPRLMRMQYHENFIPGPVYRVTSGVESLVTVELETSQSRVLSYLEAHGGAALTIDHQMVSFIPMVPGPTVRRFIDVTTGASVDAKVRDGQWIPTLRIFFDSSTSMLVNQYSSLKVSLNDRLKFRLAPDLSRLYIMARSGQDMNGYSLPIDFTCEGDTRIEGMTASQLNAIDALSYILGREKVIIGPAHFSFKSGMHSRILTVLLTVLERHSEQIECMTRGNVMQGLLKDVRRMLVAGMFAGAWPLISQMLDRSASINIERRVVGVIEGRVTALKSVSV